MVIYTISSFLAFELLAFFYQVATKGGNHMGIALTCIVLVGVLSYYFYKGFRETAYVIVMLLSIISLFSGWVMTTLLVLMVVTLFIFIINNHLFTYMDVMKQKRLQVRKIR